MQYLSGIWEYKCRFFYSSIALGITSRTGGWYSYVYLGWARVPRFGGMMTTDILKLWWGWRFWNGADEDNCLLRFWLWNDVTITAIYIILSVSWTTTTKMMLNFICIMEMWFLSYLISFLLLLMMMIVCVCYACVMLNWRKFIESKRFLQCFKSEFL